MAIAIATVMVAAGLSVAPSVAAVDADCTEDFDIADSELLASTRDLDPGEMETGLEDVEDNETNQEVTVELTSNDDKLEFGVFEDVSGCDRSNNVSSNCLSDVTLDTTDPSVNTDSETCTLESPDSGTREFFFVQENIEDPGDELEYKIFVST